MKYAHMVAFLLLVVGGINWLLVGLFQWDIGMLFGGMDAIVSRVIYVLVGVAAVYKLVVHKKECGSCSGKSAADGDSSQHAEPSQENVA